MNQLEQLVKVETGIPASTDFASKVGSPIVINSLTNGAYYMNGSTVTALVPVGTTTNDNAIAGNVGEYIESVVSAVNFPTSTQFGDLTSITLSPGDWDTTLVCEPSLNGAAVTEMTIGISQTSGNSVLGLVVGSNRVGVFFPTAASDAGGCIPAFRISLATSTIFFAKQRATYAGGPPQNFGRLSARRIR